MTNQLPPLHQRPSVLDARTFVYPYLYKFPGQESDEVILYVTREATSLLYWRYAWLTLSLLVILGLIWFFAGWLGASWQASFPLLLVAILTAICLIFGGILWYYFHLTWRKTVGIVTNYRLVKIVQYGLFNHASQTLPLSEIVDTAVSNRRFWERLLGVATLTARSSAASSGLATSDAMQQRVRINRKYFYWENISYAQDLENYIHKLLKLRQEKTLVELATFRPFAGPVKAGQRDKLKRDFPQYWS